MKKEFISLMTNLAASGMAGQFLHDEHYQILGKDDLLIDLMQSIIDYRSRLGNPGLDQKFFNKFFQHNPHLKNDEEFTKKILPLTLIKKGDFHYILNDVKLNDDAKLKIMLYFPGFSYQNHELSENLQISDELIKKFIHDKNKNFNGKTHEDLIDFANSVFSVRNLPKIKNSYFSNKEDVKRFAKLYPYFDNELKKDKDALLVFLELNKQSTYIKHIPENFFQDMDVLSKMAEYGIVWPHKEEEKIYSLYNHDLFKKRYDRDMRQVLQTDDYKTAWKNLINFYYVVKEMPEPKSRKENEYTQIKFFNLVSIVKKDHKLIYQEWKKSKDNDDGIWHKGVTPDYWIKNYFPAIQEFCRVNYEMLLIENHIEYSHDNKNKRLNKL